MASLLRFILGCVSVDEFLARYYKKEALCIHGEGDKFQGIFSWQGLNDVLNSSPQPHPGAKMSQEGRQFKPKDGIELIRAVQGGATLIIENIDRYNLILGNFLNQLSEEINQETRINMYLSYPENQGYDIHYDTHDFFILQVSGYKEWWVFPETILFPLFSQKHHSFNPPGQDACYLNCVLGPGDVLYVPRGHWHYAISRNEPSLHLTLAVFVQTGIDLMKWLVDELTENEELRESLPFLEDGIEYSEHLGRLKSELLNAMSDSDVYKRFLRHSAATGRLRHPFNFPNHTVHSLCLPKEIVLKRMTQRAYISLDQERGIIEVVCAGRQLGFEERAEPVIRFIFSRQEFSGEELLFVANGLSWQDLCSILTVLVKEGLISCV